MGRSWVPGCLGLLALGLAGCAVLPPRGEAGPAPRADSGIAALLSQAECRGLAGQRARLEAVQARLAHQGMALRVLGCPQLASGAGQQVLAVAVLVVDGERAARTVRGPLADGELLDMGSMPGLAQRVGIPATPSEPALSPDVQFNRAWLGALMGREGLRAVPGAWWAFVPR